MKLCELLRPWKRIHELEEENRRLRLKLEAKDGIVKTLESSNNSLRLRCHELQTRYYEDLERESKLHEVEAMITGMSIAFASENLDSIKKIKLTKDDSEEMIPYIIAIINDSAYLTALDVNATGLYDRLNPEIKELTKEEFDQLNVTTVNVTTGLETPELFDKLEVLFIDIARKIFPDITDEEDSSDNADD